MDLFFTVLFFCHEVDFVDSEARDCLFPLLWVSSFGEADFVDLEVRIYFLQCSSFCSGIDLLDPEARVDLIFAVLFFVVESIFWTPRHEFIFYSALPLVESIFWTPRHEVISYSGSLFDIQTPGFLW